MNWIESLPLMTLVGIQNNSMILVINEDKNIRLLLIKVCS